MTKKSLVVILLLILTITLSNKQFCEYISASEKEGYVVVIDKENSLFDKFITERADKYNVIIVNLAKDGISNYPVSILNHLRKIFDKTAFTQLVFYEKVNFLTTIKTNNGGYCSDWSEDFKKEITYRSIWNYSTNIKQGIKISIGIITENWLLMDWNKSHALNFNITVPKNFDDHKIVINKCFVFRTGTSDWANNAKELKKTAISLGIPTILGMENRTSYERELSKGDYQLTSQLTSDAISNNVVNFVCGSLEKLTINPLKLIATDFNKHPDYLTTHIWQDSDKDQFVDKDSKEITVEEIFDFNQKLDNHRRLLICPLLYKPSNLNSFYLSVVNIGDVIPYYHYMRSDLYDINYLVVWREITNQIINGVSVGEAVFQGFDRFIKKFDIKDSADVYPDIAVIFNTFSQIIIYGPPETTIKDLIENARMEILPKEIQEKSEIVISSEQDSTVITLKNTGTVLIEYEIEFDHILLDVEPYDGSIEPNQEKSVIIKINKGSYRSQSLPKPKNSKITIKSNAGDRKVVVRWIGV